MAGLAAKQTSERRKYEMLPASFWVHVVFKVLSAVLLLCVLKAAGANPEDGIPLESDSSLKGFYSWYPDFVPEFA